jgi:hypothetical protein
MLDLELFSDYAYGHDCVVYCFDCVFPLASYAFELGCVAGGVGILCL